jgi:hypothetical protein
MFFADDDSVLQRFKTDEPARKERRLKEECSIRFEKKKFKKDRSECQSKKDYSKTHGIEPSEVERRKAAGECLRCAWPSDRKGSHRVKDCVRPTKLDRATASYPKAKEYQKMKVAALELSEEESEDSEDEDSQSDDSEEETEDESEQVSEDEYFDQSQEEEEGEKEEEEGNWWNSPPQSE